MGHFPLRHWLTPITRMEKLRGSLEQTKRLETVITMVPTTYSVDIFHTED